MNPKRSSPIPIFDNLEHTGNPFKRKHFDVETVAPKANKIVGASIGLPTRFPQFVALISEAH